MKQTNLLSQVSPAFQKKVVENIMNVAKTSLSRSFRQYMRERDIAYFRDMEKKKKANVRTPAHMLRDEDPTDYKAEFEIPTVFSRVDTARSRLDSMFISSSPIFKTVSPPNLTSIAEQYDAVVEADEEKFGWGMELSHAHLDALKYDACGVEVDWEIIQVSKTARDTETNVLSVSMQQVYAGNSIRRLELNNTFWDTSCPLNKVHELGDYAGYVTPSTLPKLLTFLNGMEYTSAEINAILYPTTAQKVSPNYVDVLAGKVPLYEAPTLIPDTPAVSPEQSAALFDVPDSEISDRMAQDRKLLNQGFEITKIYLRTIPAVLSLPADSAEALIPRLYKIHILNGCRLISIEETEYQHNYMPTVFASLMNDGVGGTTRSFSHNLESLQRLANKLIEIDIQSSRRAVADRGIYNPHMIDSQQINNRSATAKIPLKSASPTADVRAAYASVPYQDSALGMRFQQAVQLLGFSDQIGGQNEVDQGGFVKGNKTNDQFQQSMQASDARMISRALGLHTALYYPVKEIIKYNISQFQTSESSYSQSLEKQVKINSDELKQMLPTFKIADGLLNAARMLNLEALTMAIQLVPSIPEFQTEYNTPMMIMDILSNGQGVKMERYKYTEAEKQAKQQQLQEQAAAQAQAEAAANPENAQQPQGQQPGMLQRMMGRG
jgi:hypothetical protein